MNLFLSLLPVLKAGLRQLPKLVKLMFAPATPPRQGLNNGQSGYGYLMMPCSVNDADVAVGKGGIRK
jgi:hypothetical protein